ncbi:MAG: glycosyltransferase [Acidaminococcus sp.]|uniref:glycosyltransferase n=1 Tax=Acidaminococcus sp. TaxID=1872103 RepID=UPI003F173210
MKIAILCFGISSISNVSGTEKVFVDMANHFAQKGHLVYSVWNDKPGVVPYYAFDPKVRQVNLELGKIKAPFYLKVHREITKGLHINSVNYVDQYKTKKLSQALLQKIDIHDVDVLICYEFNSVMVANAVSQNRIPVIAMCHNSIENQIASLTPLQRKEASKIDVLQVLLPSFVPKAKKLVNTTVVDIPNVIPQVGEEYVSELSRPKETYHAVFMGRINKEQKRPLIAVKAFLQLAPQFPQWQLDIYGPNLDSHYMEEIQKYIKDHDKGNQVHYKGITKTPAEVLKNADVFVFPSAFEGFGIALGEANVAGVPAVGFSYAPAVNDLIKDGVTGFLADNDDEFCQDLCKLMSDQQLRSQMGQNARKEMFKYSPENVWKRWDDLIEQVVEKKGKSNENV